MTANETTKFDTRELLANASKQAKEREYSDFPIVDVDFHHYENESWAEITEYIENPVIRQTTQGSLGKGRASIVPMPVGNQDMGGRISRYQLRREEKVNRTDIHRDVVITKRAMTQMGLDYVILFPTPMLYIGLHPQLEVEVALTRAYARWMTERILPCDPSIRTMLCLPFNDPIASVKLVEEFSEIPGVDGFMITSVRHKPVHHRDYAKLYATLEERQKPVAFHAAYNWQERTMEVLNRFISAHALGFTFYNMVHMCNFVINGMPELFPRLKVIWIESGLAWIPFIMQRLDNDYMMRTSEAPLLKKLPSDYMREFYYTSQPMERTNNAKALEVTFDMINAETQLLYASDYPHWDFDLPSTIYDLSFLSETAKKRILGQNACDLFGLKYPK